MDNPLPTIVEETEPFTPSVPFRMLTRSKTQCNPGTLVSATPLTSKKIIESGSKVTKKTTKKGAGRSRQSDVQSQEDCKKARLEESSHPLVTAPSIDSVESHPINLDIFQKDLKQLHEQDSSIIRILETSVIQKLDKQVVKADIKPLVESMDNFRFDLSQADLTQQTALENVTASLKKTVRNLQNIQDHYSSHEERWGSAIQKLAEQSKQLADNKEMISKMSTELAQQSKSMALIKTELAHVNSKLNSVQPVPVSKPLVPPTASNPINPKKPCVFCSSVEHPSQECDKFRDYTSRSARAIEMNICIRCCQVFTPNGTRIHPGCRAEAIQCNQCSPLLRDKKVSNHHQIFCSLIPRSQPVHRQNHGVGRGRGRPSVGQFNRNFH